MQVLECNLENNLRVWISGSKDFHLHCMAVHIFFFSRIKNTQLELCRFCGMSNFKQSIKHLFNKGIAQSSATIFIRSHHYSGILPLLRRFATQPGKTAVFVCFL